MSEATPRSVPFVAGAKCVSILLLRQIIPRFSRVASSRLIPAGIEVSSPSFQRSFPWSVVKASGSLKHEENSHSRIRKLISDQDLQLSLARRAHGGHRPGTGLELSYFILLPRASLPSTDWVICDCMRIFRKADSRSPLL
jgi:hypothetical protein